MKTGLRFGIALILVLAAILVVRTLGFESRQLSVEAFDAPDVDANAVAQRLARGLRHRTISHSVDGPVEAQAFLDLHAGLQADYPRTHAKLAREIVSDYSLLYTWKGTRPDLPAVLLLAHQDVVPVEPGSEGSWEHPPYAGDIDETYVWGRGTIDDKGALFCIMEAVEGLVSKGFQPERTVLLAFGHDEELGGPKGATQIAALLAERGVKAEYVLDEGGAVTVGTISIVPDPVAVVGIAEKGYVSIELSIETMGGHSSMPPRQTGIGILAAAIVRLEQNPVPGGIGGAVDIMFDHLGPELDFPIKLVMANRWLFNPLLERAFSGEPTLDAMQRTTTAATIFNGGVKPNVLPSRVKATVNFR
ncbi:MAG: M20/M25/M40 family metallo-hydrolase, partial [Deltaproteobacteria bacterium]|nr:M20/M25/M40 family metallo-hydrolase [Deltaproteobacteria bacterium]